MWRARGGIVLQGQAAPGWDLDQAGLGVLFRDLGIAGAEEYIKYKAETSVRPHVAKL
jgi:hypothetical protein